MKDNKEMKHNNKKNCLKINIISHYRQIKRFFINKFKENLQQNGNNRHLNSKFKILIKATSRGS